MVRIILLCWLLAVPLDAWAGKSAPRIDLKKVKLSSPSGKGSVGPKAPAAARARAPRALTAAERKAFHARVRQLARARRRGKTGRAKSTPSAGGGAPMKMQFLLTEPKTAFGGLGVTSKWAMMATLGDAPYLLVLREGKIPKGSIGLHLKQLTKGKVYAVDCAVGGNAAAWEFNGAVSGEIAVQSGHVLAAFVAASDGTMINMYPAQQKQGGEPSASTGDTVTGSIYGCEVTRVD